MPLKLQAFVVLPVWIVAATAAAQETASDSESDFSLSSQADPDLKASEGSPSEESAAEAAPPESAEAPTGASAELRTETSVGAAPVDEAASSPEAAEAKPAPPPAETEQDASKEQEGWDTSVSGYFRAPMAIGFSPRPGPDDLDGKSELQMSYGPNRTVDANYFSFAYTRLQEQDWSELFVHAKKKHVEAVVGWMGYWFQSTGFRNLDAAWAPGVGYLTLDSDFEIAGLKPNIALTAGAWWPKFGYVEKYDTFTLGQFRQMGEQLRLTVPINSSFSTTIVQGVGTSRDGSFNLLAPPPYQAKVGADIIHYEHVQFNYEEYVEVGLHYNSQFTRDPNLFITNVPGKAFNDAREAYLKTIGGEVTLSAPYAGSLWVSPSFIRIRNGWALGEAGVEVMHSLSAEGLAVNYLGWSGSLPDSTGSGEMLNVGFLYENSLSGIQGLPRGTLMPEVTLNVFGLFTDIRPDLPEGSVIGRDRIGQFKYGADVEVQPLDWLGIMLRWDEVNYNLGHPGYLFSAISPRLTFSSHYLSGESIYLQYSRYRYGDGMTLAGRWPWGTPLVAGSDIIQGGAYNNETPDMDVIRVQATVKF